MMGAQSRPRIGAHHYSATNLPAADFVRVAANCGCAGVSLFMHRPDQRSATAPVRDFPFVTDEQMPRLEAVLRETRLEVRNLDSFPIFADTDVRVFRPALERGRVIGARRVVVTLQEPGDRPAALLRELCDMLVDYGMGASLEFMPLAPGCRTLDSALEKLAQVDRDNLGIGVDAIHLFRSGGTVDAVRAVARQLITHVQIDDQVHPLVADDYWEQSANRLVPGTGQFPLAALCSALPGVEIEFEVPNLDRNLVGADAADYVRTLSAVTTDLVGGQVRGGG